MTFIKNAGYEFDFLDITIHDYDDEYVENYIRENPYDVILMGSIVTHYKWIKWCVKIIKKHQPNCKIVVGNSVAGSIYEVFLNNTPADVVVIGEGEFSTLETLNAFRDDRSLSGIKGIAYRAADGSIRKNEKRPACKIDDLLPINWELFEVDKYFEKLDATGAFGAKNPESGKWRTMPVPTARGCVFKCTFCHYVFWDDPYRHRSAENILAECKSLIEKYGVNYINFWDDLSFSSLSQAEKIVDQILASGLKFYWSAAIRSDLFGKPQIDYERRRRIAQKFKDSGCISVGFSLESANAEILEMMNKRIKHHYFEEQIKLLRDVGIVANTSIVFGYPIETKETIKETFDYCSKTKVYPSIGILLPLPYTGMYEYAKTHGFIVDEDRYLETITERQDLCLNLTKMSDKEFLTTIKEGAKRLNIEIDIGLSEDSFMRTGGYRKHNKLNKIDKKASFPIRNKADFSFNYSNQNFDLGPGGDNQQDEIEIKLKDVAKENVIP